MWTEKYRPRSLSEIVGHEALVHELRSYLAAKDPPHLMLVGPPGCGKTSIALAFGRDLLGEWYSDDFLEVNASDDRSLTALRARVLPFVRLKPWNGMHIVFLDEADGLAPDAQDALRRPMELNERSTRWILAANTLRMNLAMISRCRVLEVPPLRPADIVTMLKRVCQGEGIEGADALVRRIADYCEGDMRRAMHELRASVEVGA